MSNVIYAEEWFRENAKIPRDVSFHIATLWDDKRKEWGAHLDIADRRFSAHDKKYAIAEAKAWRQYYRYKSRQRGTVTPFTKADV